MNKAIFAAGCFWGVQYYFDQIPGVVKSEAGYTGGNIERPTYEQVCSGDTGHAEAVLIEFDDKTVDYRTLIQHFFRLHDPTQVNRQGPDVGHQYRSAIFCMDAEQQRVAHEVMALTQAAYDKPIATEITPAGPFFPAEEYHQKFTERTGRGMCHVAYKKL